MFSQATLNSQEAIAPVTCATCPFATHIEGNKYACNATHNHHNQVTRGHWAATADCYDALENREQEPTDSNEVEYVFNLEAKLEARATEAEQHFTDTEVDSAADAFGLVYRVWKGMKCLGTFYRSPADERWVAEPFCAKNSQRYLTANEAQRAIERAWKAVA